ncbi:MAG: flagellar hook-associated protein 3 [Desulfovibrio sp.]|nr:MAG: flagellar hook-associated protein 3 [Desulfovibrio sp.]
MAVRVSHQSLFNNFVTHMNKSLVELMDMNIQASSQKKINKPSDDPAGTARVLSYRSNLSSLGQYRENIDSARGWLGMADSTLIQVNTVLTRCKELAEQAATGTYSKENRDQISFEVRELFEQLITLSNTEYEGKHIFSGHKVDESAFVETMAVTTNDAALSNATFSITGASSSTVLVQFTTAGTVGTDALDFRYSRDGGDSWTNGTLAAGATEIDLNGVRVDISPGTVIQAVDITNTSSTNNGTWLWVRPAAMYQGDDVDAIEVDHFGAANVTTTGTGYFEQDVYVRIDNAAAVNLSGAVSYSYSLDRGVTWVTGNTKPPSAVASNAALVVPGGFLELSSNGGNTLSPGEQFIIRPRRAELRFEISPSDYVAVNAVGKDVFGGLYVDPAASNASAALGGSARNMFETVGELVGYIETNNQDGIQRALEALRTASEHVLTQAGKVGGRENRLDTADNVLSSLELTNQERMSTVEDVDVAELMTDLAHQQIVYESVLKSSSTIMRMSLVNYI